MRRIPVIALIVLTLALPIPALAQSATPAASSPSAASGDFAGLVDIGGRSLYLECHGTGSPTVILVAAIAPPAASGATTCSSRTPHGRWCCPGWRSSPASVPTTARGPRQHRRGRLRQPQ